MPAGNPSYARPLLERIATALADARLEAILIGNAAAALWGAPVTTVDFDFMFRATPYYPASDMFRVVNDDIGLQADFLATIHGVRSFESLRARAKALAIGRGSLLVASLEYLEEQESCEPAEGPGGPRRAEDDTR